MNKKLSAYSKFKGLNIAITGAQGSLGQSLIEDFKGKGAYVIGLTHNKKNTIYPEKATPNEWIIWSCGEEKKLSSKLANIDILILNHGFNPKGNIDSNKINKAIEINSLSHWRLIQLFENIVQTNINHQDKEYRPKEIWVNTSEAEIQIAFSPVYEITKRLIGEIVSLKKSQLLIEKNNSLIIKKLVLGPFKSELNPQGIMNSNFVAKQIIKRAEKKNYLIIVSPNPLTYLLMPLAEITRILYTRFIKNIYSQKIPKESN
tara:strand:- start:1431 stop:2210 length:780 start_codon:yes stop_codon:yes gene_type:complete